MELTMLGTSCMMPTKARNTSAALLQHKGEGILVDCGEGTQRQFRLAGMSPTAVTKVLVSHWHGDHVLGLPGLIMTLGASGYQRKLDLYGPVGSKRQVKLIFDAFYYDAKIDLEVHEVEDGSIFEGKDFRIEALPLKHKVPCVGYAVIEADRRRIDLAYTKKLGIPEGPLLGELQDGRSITWKGKTVTPKEATLLIPGRKVAFITDTTLVPNCYTLAQDADLLVCESSFASELEEQAREYGHMTAKEAATIADKAGAKQLLLTHFSARYADIKPVLEDARKVFRNALCASDFLRLEVPLREGLKGR
jgi:ribonuclease Z